MTHTFYQNYYHIVWSTKERKPTIPDEYKSRIFEYLGGSLKTLDCIPIQIGGMSDHIHMLAGIPPQHAVSEVIRDIKISSNRWINSTLPQIRGFSWQEGYGSFSVSSSQKNAVINYIINQESHHKTRNFREEFLELLRLSEITFDEKYLWK